MDQVSQVSMPFGDAHSLVILLTVMIGSSVYLRLVAKEKHRREKYLKQRLEDKINELKQEAEQKADQATNVVEAVSVADSGPT